MILLQAVLTGDLLRHLSLSCPLLGENDISFGLLDKIFAQ